MIKKLINNGKIKIPHYLNKIAPNILLRQSIFKSYKS